MSDAFEEYHRVRGPDGKDVDVFMSWAAYWEPSLQKLMRGPMLRLEVHEVCEEFSSSQLSKLNTGETSRDYADPETRDAVMSEWLKHAFL